jgi:dihydrodipicolinate synthase/N-acetylneuraminate lyase
MHKTPTGYERKFADFIRLCAESKEKGVGNVLVSHPSVLGDNYAEVIESLSRLADSGLALNIAGREVSPSRN